MSSALLQFCVLLQSLLKDFRLLLCCRPVLFFHGFGEARQFQMGISKSCAVEDVLEPGASGDAVGVEPVALELHHAVVQSRCLLGIDLAGGELRERDSFSFFPASSNASIAFLTSLRSSCVVFVGVGYEAGLRTHCWAGGGAGLHGVLRLRGSSASLRCHSAQDDRGLL